MTFNQIRYFITVAECLSFTEAAKCLFLTQPALSRQISAMEEAKSHDITMAWKKNNYNPAIAIFMEMVETTYSGQ
ncbi:MAG: LysR family transcriptional regulator [Clostridiales bacterium]|nr:LysR family transcriptional regulator [Clostridiales bacterium]